MAGCKTSFHQDSQSSRCPVLHIGLVVPLFGHLLFIFCIFVPTVLRSGHSKCSLRIVFFWTGDTFSTHLCQFPSSLPTAIGKRCNTSVSSFSLLFDDTKLCVGLCNPENLFQSSCGHSSLVVWVVHPADFRAPMARVLLIFLNPHSLKSQYGTEMVREPFSIFV